MPLTDADLSRLEPETRDRKLFDGRGLYLLVRSNGARYWRLKYRFAGKEKVLALGVWPQVSLQDARQAADMARDQLGRGLDPMQARQRPQPAPSASDTPNTTPKAPVMEPIRQSQKLANVCYDIRGPIMERARRMEEDGQRIIKLNIGNPAPFGFLAPEEIMQDMIRNLPQASGYSDSKGLFAPRKSVVHYCQEKGIQRVTVDDVYLGNGAS